MLELTMTSTKIPWFQRLADMRKGTPKDTIPQALADSWTEVMVEAVRAFHETDFDLMPAMDYVDVTSDKDVSKRIRGYQEGYDLEFLRKAVGYSEEAFDLKSYDFSTLPWPTQRAVVSHWDRLHHEFLAAHKGLAYYPDVGYVWLIEHNGETARIPHRDADCGEVPDEDDLIRVMGYVVQGPYGAQIDIGLAEYDL
ncbi:hypothetical protein LCGC14_1927580 [marine sediment metagenome]|uniref:Uncharacterized protein n=1 Tax=marine sediment metagenome TaxID=412755 RepID=A0A0F9GC84_9ZZZZ